MLHVYIMYTFDRKHVHVQANMTWNRHIRWLFACAGVAMYIPGVCSDMLSMYMYMLHRQRAPIMPM